MGGCVGKSGVEKLSGKFVMTCLAMGDLLDLEGVADCGRVVGCDRAWGGLLLDFLWRTGSEKLI